MSLIMAMAMKRKFVAQFFPSTEMFGENVINFYLISVSEEEFTPSAFPLLFLEKQSHCPAQNWSRRKSLAPVEEVSVVRAGRSFHFDMPSDLGVGVLSKV